jgi:uncharacterized protein YndB with AHSA1/START domain
MEGFLLLRIAILVGVVIAAVLIFAASKQKLIHLQRSVTIDAPAEKIFPLINDFHNWNRWAPQDREDPTMQRTYSGPENGANTISDWESRGSAGRGRMSIVESEPPSRVVVQVDFVKPFVAHNVNEFILQPGSQPGSPTKVTWTMQGSNLYVMKLMSVFVNMDRMMGQHFETGLKNLKNAAEQ